MERRDFLLSSAALAGAFSLGRNIDFGRVPETTPTLFEPISDDERRARIAKAQRLMMENKIDALVLEGGTSMNYFTGTRWGNSERTFAVVIPAKGELAWVTPGFEVERARELIKLGTDIRAWQEDESPYRVIGNILRDRKATNRVGMEERLRFFVYDGVRKELPRTDFAIATPITAGCRMIKSPSEIALLKKANEITLQAIGESFKSMKEGMTTQELGATFASAVRRLGGISDGALVIFGKYTAFPHGSVQPQRLKEGDVVLIDAGCTVEGYVSDVTRTTVFGSPTQRMRDVWDIEKRAQSAALAAAQIGATCESVDTAARKVITDAGFGPDYKVPGLPHRTGHGIGMDGHEWTNFVRGNKTKIQPGMCFSDEPTIVSYGEFGIRLEDCLHISDNGPVMFTPQSPSIAQPV
jgi:Xaa-Pro dipeptidase